MAAIAADRNLLFGLIALQNGLIDQVQLVAAFQAWTRNKGRTLADHLVARGDLDADDRSALEALVARHLRKHGGAPETSLAALAAGRSTRESLARIGDADIEASLAELGRTCIPDGEDPDRTATYTVGTATSDGQRFRVLRPHARGGLGAVFVALDTELHREVALKQILDSHADDETSRARFLLEAEITGGLEHPGIVPVYGLGTYSDGRPYYAMRFIRGDSLKESLERFHADEALRSDPGRRALELRKLLRRFTDVCNAIDYAHSRGVLHRDIKPGNIIVGRHGETLVVDWGLAKATGQTGPESGERTLVPSSTSGSAETLPGSALGTPAYMSPEQAEGDLEHLGPRSDVYSLGATLYCLLTGRPPFGGEAPEVIPAVQKGEFPPPRTIDASIDPALEAVCLKAMAPKPEDRYGSCGALAEDIERWMADEPVIAWREPFSRRARRWARRNRTVMTAVAVALVAGVVGLVAVAGIQARANRDLRRSNAATRAALAETRKAQAETQAALAQSEESRQQAEAVSRFLVDTFRSPDPRQDGRQVKVADVLDRAGTRLDRGFAGSRATLGALWHALGQTYLGLGLYDKAVVVFTKARAVRESALGPDHPETLGTCSNLGVSYWYAGRLDEAIALHEATLRRRQAALGPDHPETLSSRNNLAIAYREAGRVSEANALDEVTLRLREAALGPNHPETLASRNNLAMGYRRAGRVSEAIALDEATLRVREAALGPDHPETLSSRSNLAADYWSAGRLDEAIALDRVTLELMEAKLGADHPTTLISRMGLANACDDAGRTSEAIALYRATLAMQEVKLGANHPHTLLSRNNLAEICIHAGRTAEAVALCEAALRVQEANLGAHHPDTLMSRGTLAEAYEALGRSAEAEDLDRGTLARRRKTVPASSPLLAGDLARLGRDLLNQARWSEAEALLRECLAVLDKAAPDDWEHDHAKSLLGGALLGQGRFAEAERLVVTGYEGMNAREKRIPVPMRSRLLAAAMRVVQLYETWNKPDQAAAWKAKLGLPDLPADAFARP